MNVLEVWARPSKVSTTTLFLCAKAILKKIIFKLQEFDNSKITYFYPHNEAKIKVNSLNSNPKADRTNYFLGTKLILICYSITYTSGLDLQNLAITLTVSLRHDLQKQKILHWRSFHHKTYTIFLPKSAYVKNERSGFKS